MSETHEHVERPVAAQGDTLWGSDHLAEMFRRLGFRHVALNPGSSFRGLHDSLVNHLGNRDPMMLLCLHEEHAVAIAHGWAKVTGEPMAVILHANVGLMHGSMAIYNAWCDRVPMAIFGATGPVDAHKRRPWIDWIHTSRDQAAIVRPYVKWDDQPAGLEASLASMVRADAITRTAPQAPTYVCFDVTVQEEASDGTIVLPDPAQFRAPEPPHPSPAQMERLIHMLSEARNPAFLMGRVSRSEEHWARRVALAEHTGAKVVTDIKTGASFPSEHPNHVGPPSFVLANEPASALADADLIVSFDWVDAAGALRQAGNTAPVVYISLDHQLANGWSLDNMAQPAATLHIAAEPDTVIAALADRMGIAPGHCAAEPMPAVDHNLYNGTMSMDAFADALDAGLAGQTVCFVRLPLGWDGSRCRFSHPLDYLGYDGGAGIGSGPGMLVGAALALRGSGRIPFAVLGDGDTMMGNSALWTAARYNIPFIAVICNNRSYFNDEVHQEKVARTRQRPVENKSIGQAMREPDIDFAAIARAQGVEAIGPVDSAAALAGAIADALDHFRAGRPVLIDARVQPEYSEAMAKGMTESAD